MFETNAETVIARIEERRAELGLSEREVEDRAGHGSWIRNLRSGKTKRVNRDKLAAIADALATTPEALMMPSTSPGESIASFRAAQAQHRAARVAEAAKAPAPAPLPVAGDLAAAVWVDPDRTGIAEHGTVGPDSRWPAQAQSLYRVRDRSLDLVAPAGTVLLALDVAAIGRDVREGDLVIVERTERTADGAARVERTGRVVGRDGEGRPAFLPATREPGLVAALPLVEAGEGVRVVALVVTALVSLVAAPILTQV